VAFSLINTKYYVNRFNEEIQSLDISRIMSFLEMKFQIWHWILRYVLNILKG